MEIASVLRSLGLGKGEIEVYLILLKEGMQTVSKIQDFTKLHRTTIYDFLGKLIDKGLASYVVHNGTKNFQATGPEKLNEYLHEKEQNLAEIMPQLLSLTKSEKKKIVVEVFSGREGFKTILNDVIRLKANADGFGIDESNFKERFPYLMEQYFREEEKLGLCERMLTSDGARFVYRKKTTNYRFIPEEYFNPIPTLIYADRIAIVIWEPLTVIRIINSDLAENYRKHFEMLWKIAKKQRSDRKQSSSLRKPIRH